MRFSCAILFLVAALVLTGMGNLGGVPDGRIPETKENIRARVVDRQGISTELEKFSMDGKEFLSAARGSGTVSIPFRDIRLIEFGDIAGNMVHFQVHLAGGERLSLQIEQRSIFYGSPRYGYFQIRARDVGRIEFPRETAP